MAIAAARIWSASSTTRSTTSSARCCRSTTKSGGESTALANTYGTALFLLDLFDIDSDYVVPGFGHPGIDSYADFTVAPRNNNTYAPTTVWEAPTAAGLTPWVQFGRHDHVVVYDLIRGVPRFFPVMDGTTGNPDGDIQLQRGTVTSGPRRRVFIDPLLVNLPPMDVVHYNVQAGGSDGTIFVNTIREYSELAANGWEIDYSTLKDPYHTVSPLARWYTTCFDANGVFTVSKNSHCKFSVKPQDLVFLH